jgi:hypothetical protein
MTAMHPIPAGAAEWRCWQCHAWFGFRWPDAHGAVLYCYRCGKVNRTPGPGEPIGAEPASLPVEPMLLRGRCVTVANRDPPRLRLLEGEPSTD